MPLPAVTVRSPQVSRALLLSACLAVSICAGTPAVSRALPATVNPFQTSAMRSFLASRGTSVTAAVYDLMDGREYVYRPGVREQTASIVKVDILETLLHELHGGPLSGADAATARGMIEESDNDDATSLWDQEGGAPAVAAYDGLAGMGQTTPNGAWGLTETTPADQITLLRQLVTTDGLLDAGAQDYELGLMQGVEPGQHWGVSGGVPPGVSVALKNGWLPVGNGWQINSIGRIKGDGRWYLIAVMTNGDPSMGYGIDTIEGISSIVFRDLPERYEASLGASRATG